MLCLKELQLRSLKVQLLLEVKGKIRNYSEQRIAMFHISSFWHLLKFNVKSQSNYANVKFMIQVHNFVQISFLTFTRLWGQV